MRDYARFTMVIVIATLASIMWLGPYWFILIAGILCFVWVLFGIMQASGNAAELERERWAKDRGDEPRGGGRPAA